MLADSSLIGKDANRGRYHFTLTHKGSHWDMNHTFLTSVLTSDFISHDLRLTARNLRKERDASKGTEILDEIDTTAVTRRLMALPDIHNRPEQTVKITNAHATEIKEYLAALDLIVNVPIETAERGSEPVEYVRDCSRKQKAQYQIRGKSGKPVTNTIPYGFKKDPEEKHRWLVDGEAADVDDEGLDAKEEEYRVEGA